MSDLTDLAAAAAANDPRAVAALAAGFSRARLHLPLETLDGVRNRPETVRELGARLPVHRLRLDNGESGVPFFTNAKLCQRCADHLSWKTDGKAIKTLRIPGSVALSYARDVLVTPRAERVIVNPLSGGALHLARTDIEEMAAGRELRHLGFYASGGRLIRPVSIEGGSLLENLLASADKALQRLADGRLHHSDSMDATAIFENLPAEGPLRGLAADLYLLVAERGFADLELTVSKSGGEVRVTAIPDPDPALLERIRVVAEKNLSATAGDTTLSFRFRGGSIVVSSSSGPSRSDSRTTPVDADSAKMSPPAPPIPHPSFRYIPLEPEPIDDDESQE